MRLTNLREKEVERDRQLAHNWRNGRYRSAVVAAVTEDYVRKISFNDNFISFGTSSGGVVFCDMTSGFRLKCSKVHVGQITAIDYRDSYIASVGSMDRIIAIWNVADFEKSTFWTQAFPNGSGLEAQLPSTHVLILGHNDLVTSLRLDVKHDRVYSASVDGTVIVSDLSGNHIRTIRVGEPIFSMVLTEKQHLLVGCKSGRVQAYAADRGLYLFSMLCHSSHTTALDYWEEGEILVTGDSSGRISLWSFKDNKFVASLPAHDAAVTSVQCDGFKIVSASRDGSIAIAGLECHTRFYTIHGFTKYLACARFDSTRLIADGTNDVIVCHRFDSQDKKEESR